MPNPIDAAWDTALHALGINPLPTRDTRDDLTDRIDPDTEPDWCHHGTVGGLCECDWVAAREMGGGG